MDAFSPYTLIDVQVVESSMITNVDLLQHPASDKRPLQIQEQYIRLEEEDGSRKSCELGLFLDYDVYHEKVKGSRKKPKPAVKLHVVLRGLVTALFTDDTSDEEQDYLLRVNATSLLYAEARAHLLMLTALSPAGKVILPPIAPFVLVDKLLKDEKSAE